ncbi:SNAP receptor [Pichia kluyveri]|uniref:SNAP receptor n=1 Tax=Pichia kluyveri TaxID=36015 RepID=A0AAV5R1V2_PICKL|nr:SNAP receptor [Pichia kluyveri]
MSSAQAYDPYNPFDDDAAAELANQSSSPFNHNQNNNTTNANPSSKLQNLQSTLDDTAGMMRDNIEAINQRGEVLDDIDNRAYSLQNNASLFNKSANQVRKDMWKKNLKLKLCVALIIIIIIIVVVVPIAVHFSN